MATNYKDGFSRIQPHTWKIAFIFAFLALLVDGADLMLLSYSLNSIKADFGLSSVQAGMLGSFTLAGMAVGGIFGGWACDKFGRVRIVVISILTFSLLTCGLGFTQSFLQFGILRFFASLGLGSLYIACNTLMAEYVPTRYRTTVLGTLQAGWTVGYIVATLLAGWIIPDHGWRMLFYVAIIPVVIAVLMHVLVPEPEAWQKSRLQQPVMAQNASKTSAFKLIFQDKRNRNMF
ncbi:MFS transporter, partial [Acinetobacter baumannii]